MTLNGHQEQESQRCSQNAFYSLEKDWETCLQVFCSPSTFPEWEVRCSYVTCFGQYNINKSDMYYFWGKL